MAEQQYKGRVENIFVFPFDLVSEEIVLWQKLSPRIASHLSELLVERNTLRTEIDAMRDFMALLYLGIREGRDEAFEALDDKTRHLINEVWFERLEEDG